MAKKKYTEDSVKSLDWREHMRLRPGMYIGKLGNGSASDDGIYVLLKEIIDNSVDEHIMGHGKTIEIELDDHKVRVRDHGRGIPLGSVVDCVSKINTGAKYDSEVFQKSVGLNGVGTKAVNALSTEFIVTSFREGKMKSASFSIGNKKKDNKVIKTDESDGTLFEFVPDNDIFTGYRYRLEHVKEMLWNYAFLNPGLTLICNGESFHAEDGLKDLLAHKYDPKQFLYPIIHFKTDDMELALTHSKQYGEEYYTYVNGGFTPMGGTHLSALKEAIVKGIRDFYNKDFDSSDIRGGIIASFSIRIQEPIFESQTKTKLGSQHISPGGKTIKTHILEYIQPEINKALHRSKDIATALKDKIIQNERERKEMAGIRRMAGARAKKASLFNKKLRDCKVHLNSKHKNAEDSTIFITEGDSASGSITKSRDPMCQAVFSLRGKPLNTFSLSKKVVYENEEFNLLHHALNIEEGIEGLRYNKIILATDADVDGMHIRLLLLTYFLQFFPELIRGNHVFVLQTPLFRVRNKKETIYCYDEGEKKAAVKKLGGKPEITRFKGLGEISPDEFKQFIGENMRLDPVTLSSETKVGKLLKYYMGKNTPERQSFIIENLLTESDVIEAGLDNMPGDGTQTDNNASAL